MMAALIFLQFKSNIINSNWYCFDRIKIKTTDNALGRVAVNMRRKGAIEKKGQAHISLYEIYMDRK